jgi:crotonobetainyl-CoA:carnitine CoA-transferase CaiB-like acyl-CoA transferase
MRKGPLAGVRVLDATRALAGPLTTMVLGDLGADVIKLELPGAGDETRFWGPPFAKNAGPTFIAYNRNKRSVAIDLHNEEGRKACLALARSSDVFVENFRPGTMQRFRLGYDEMKAARPDIIYCSISGYGQTGPMAKRPALDLMVQAVSGLMSLTGDPAGRPVKASAPVADVMGGLCATIAIMGALMERTQTGEGRYLDISMLDGIMTLMGQAVAVRGMSGKSPGRMGNAHPLMAPYESFRCSDREIVIAVTNEKSWGQFAAIAEFRTLAKNPLFVTPPLRSQNRSELLREIERVFLEKPAVHWLAALEAAGIPVEPINTLDEVLAHPQLAERRTIIPVEYPAGSGNHILTSGMPWRAVASERPHRSPPDLGEHTREVLDELLGIAGTAEEAGEMVAHGR